MGFIDQIENWVEKRSNPERHHLEVANSTQTELIQAFGGDDRAGIWIDAYARRFRELMDEPELHLEDRLTNSETHAEALEELKKKLYH